MISTIQSAISAFSLFCALRACLTATGFLGILRSLTIAWLERVFHIDLAMPRLAKTSHQIHDEQIAYYFSSASDLHLIGFLTLRDKWGEA
ncbi:MAG: hypothetical protein ACXW39_07675 [Nitrospira sp.]